MLRWSKTITKNDYCFWLAKVKVIQYTWIGDIRQSLRRCTLYQERDVAANTPYMDQRHHSHHLPPYPAPLPLRSPSVESCSSVMVSDPLILCSLTRRNKTILLIHSHVDYSSNSIMQTNEHDNCLSHLQSPGHNGQVCRVSEGTLTICRVC